MDSLFDTKGRRKICHPSSASKSISRLIALMGCLYALPAQYRWTFADEDLLMSIAKGEAHKRGIFGNRLSILVKASLGLRLAWPLLSLVGLVELLKLLFRQSVSTRNNGRRSCSYPTRFFVGFGAGSEEELFKGYSENHSGKVEKLSQIEIGSFASWHSVGTFSGLRALVEALATARMAIAELPPDLAPWRVDFLTHIGMRIGYFAYMRAWFAILKTRSGDRLDEVAFLTGYMPAFAAADLRLPTCYLQHGLLSYSVTLMPEFTRIEALTVDEAKFMSGKLPNAKVIVCPRQQPMFAPSQLRREALITSIYGTADYMSQGIAPFIRWASDNKIPVRVRPHPRETGTFWFDYEANGEVFIENADSSFLHSIDRLRPRINVSWFSTTLADSLEYGVIPVTVSSDDDPAVLNMVYPLFERALLWPRDAESIVRLMADDGYYRLVLARLREGLPQ